MLKLERKGGNWLLSTGGLTAVVHPAQGCKLASLRSRASGREFFFQDPRRRPSGPGYLGHDIGGMDECWPTVGRARGRFGADHGVLWTAYWTARRDGERLVTRALRPGGAPVDWVRVLSAPGPGRLRLETTVRNLSDRPLPFLYSAHPILAVDERTRLVLSGVRRLRVLGHNGRLAAQRFQPWPRARLAAGGHVRLDTGFAAKAGLAGKWFARGSGRVAAEFPDTGERLVLRWDAQALPWLGVWISLGVPLAAGMGASEGWQCAALEPCTTPQDVLGAGAPLRLGRTFKFWLEWELVRPGRRNARS